MLRFLFLLCCICSVATSLIGQNNKYVDIVVAKDGKTYEGKIIRYEAGEFLTILLADEKEITLGFNEIRRISYETIKDKQKRERSTGMGEAAPFTPSTKAWRHFIGLTITAGRERLQDQVFGGNPTNSIVGYAIQYQLSRRLSPWLFAGAGLGYSSYNQDRGERTIEGTALARVLFSQSRIGAFGQMEVGYAKPIRTAGFEFEDIEGGVLLYPSVGVRFGGTDQPEFTMDVGYRFLNTTYAIESFQGREVRNNAYRRLSLRLGMLF